MKYKLLVLYPIDDLMASLLKKLGNLLVWMSWVMEMWQFSRAKMNTNILSWKKHTNMNILMNGGKKILQYLEKWNGGLPLLRDLGKLFWMLSRM